MSDRHSTLVLRPAAGNIQATIRRVPRCPGTMTRSKWFMHAGRALEIRDHRVMTALEVWIYEDDRPLALHSTLTLREAAAGLAAGRDVLGQAMEKAIRDVETGRSSLGSSPAPVAAE